MRALKDFYFPQLTDSLPPVPFLMQAPEDAPEPKKKKAEKKKEVKETGQATIEKPVIPPLPSSIRLPEKPSSQILGKAQSIESKILKPNVHFDESLLFANHELKPFSEGPKLFIKSHQYWPAGILFLGFLVFVVVKVFYFKSYSRLSGIFFANRSINRLQRGEYPLTGRAALLLSFLFILVFSFFLYQYFDFSGAIEVFELKGIKGFLTISLFLLSAYFFKIILIKISGYIFNAEQGISEYISGLFIFNNMLGLLLLPLTILITYNSVISLKTLFTIGFSSILLFIFVRVGRIMFTGMRNAGISTYYLFLYLCAFEIVPLLVIIKFFINKTGKV